MIGLKCTHGLSVTAADYLPSFSQQGAHESQSLPFTRNILCSCLHYLRSFCPKCTQTICVFSVYCCCILLPSFVINYLLSPIRFFSLLPCCRSPFLTHFTKIEKCIEAGPSSHSCSLSTSTSSLEQVSGEGVRTISFMDSCARKSGKSTMFFPENKAFRSLFALI